MPDVRTKQVLQSHLIPQAAPETRASEGTENPGMGHDRDGDRLKIKDVPVNAHSCKKVIRIESGQVVANRPIAAVAEYDV
jgi:hypothetical protein